MSESNIQLKQILAELGSGQATIGRYRTGLCKIICAVLADVTKVSSEIAKAGSQIELWFKFITHCIEDFPQVFSGVFPGHSDLSSATRLVQEGQEESQCQGLTRWVVYRLMSILSHEGCEKIHDNSSTILIALIQMFKAKDPYRLQQLLVEFISCMAELVLMSEEFYKEDGEDYKGKLSHFLIPEGFRVINEDKAAEYEVHPQPIIFTEPNSCEMLQIAITCIVKEVCSDVCQFAAPKLLLLWGTLCSQIELGDLHLKKVSLELSNDLVLRQGLPDPQVLDNYLSCLLALLDMLCSQLHTDGQDQLSSLQTASGLEEALADCLLSLIACQGKSTQLIKLNRAQLERSLEAITESLHAHGMHWLQSSKLKGAVCSMVAGLYQHIPQHSLSGFTMTAVRKQLTLAMLTELHNSQESQHLLVALYTAVKFEVNCGDKLAAAKTAAMEAGKSGTSAADTDLSSDEQQQQPSSKKSRLATKEIAPPGDGQAQSGGDSLPEMTEISWSYSLLYQTLLKLCESVRDNARLAKVQDESVEQLEGIRVIVEVIVWCTALHSCSDNNTGAETSLDITPVKKGKVCAESPSVLALWWSEAHMRLLCSAWKSAMHRHSADDREAFSQLYTCVVKTIGSCLFVQDLAKYPADIIQTFTWILSLHWLPNDLSWMDLKPVDRKEVAQLSSTVADAISVEARSECIQLLALCPKETSLKWRTHVLKMCMGDASDAVRIAAVRCFPFFLYHSGPNANHLVYDLIHAMFNDSAETVLVELGRICGPLACVVSRKAILHRPAELLAVEGKSSFTTLSLQCVSCDSLPDLVSTGSPKTRPKIVNPTMFLPFLQLLEHSHTVKTSVVHGFRKLFGHIDVRSNNAATVNMLKVCLELIEDPHYDVRIAFSQCVKYLVGERSSESSSETDKTIVAKLGSAFHTAKGQGNLAVQETIVLTSGQLGRVAEGELLLVLLLSLLERMMAQSPLITATAHSQLRQLAKHKNVKMQTLFMQFRQDLIKFLVDKMHEAKLNPSGKEPEQILQEVADVFDYSDVKSFLQSTEKYILPHLISKATPTASALIKMIATLLNISRKKLLIVNTKHAFIYLIRFRQKPELEKALKYLQNETKLEIGNLLRLDFQRLHNELLLYLSTHYQQVFSGLAMLASKDQNYKGPKDIKTAEQMADFLQPRLLGILAFFDSQLLNANIPLEEKKLTLESLVSIIKMMGPKHITTYRVKVSTTLRMGLRFKQKGFPELNCRAWDSFVRCVDLTSMGPMLSQIIVTLLPLLNALPRKVAEIFSYLIVENRKRLQQHFHELYFMPDIPELADVTAVLKSYTEGPSSFDMKKQMSSLLEGVAHESFDVRIHALNKLKQLLHNNQSTIQDLVLGSETADPIISQVVSVLLSGCRESDPEARILLGECLGELGAIDPGRLELLSNKPKEDLNKFQASVEDENFAFDLINEVVRAFLAAENTRKQDCSAFAIQEILAIYYIGEGPESREAGRRIWKRLPPHIQEIITPFMHSRYILSSSSDWSRLVKPIYLSKKGNVFKDWVCTWTAYLTTKVKSEKAKKVFSSCEAVIKNDINIALYLLPHILVQALLDLGNSAAQETSEICSEILAVLSHVQKPNTRHGSVSDIRHMSAQTVFSVLDHLTKWKRHRTQVLSNMAASSGYSRSSRNTATPASAPSTSDDPHYLCVHSFLEKIPQDILASASFNCDAYARSLMHFEQFISSKGENIQEHLDFFQKLYVAMDEPDGVAAVTAIRQDKPTLQEQIRSHESIGQLCDATACYEKVIQLEPDDVTTHQGLVRNLMDLGQLNTAMELVNGVLSNNRPSWSGQLNAYRVEAAWKLSKWDKLSTYLQTEKQGTSWNVGLGKIIQAAKNMNMAEFSQQLHAVRSAQMGPLSAASMETGSYQRGYEYIVRLHMLKEIDEGMQTLLDFPVTASSSENKDCVDVNRLLSTWRSRFDLTQASFRTQEPILNLQRTVLNLARHEKNLALEKDIGLSWLHSAKVSRKAGHIQTAYSALLNANAFNLPEHCLEKAKWLWNKSDYDQAQTCLEKGIAEHFADRAKYKLDQSEEGKMAQLACAKALLYLGRYTEETASAESNIIMKQYREVVEVYPQWEEGYFYQALYYLKVMNNLVDQEKPEKKGQFIIYVITNFGNSLKYGCQHIYQSLPHLLLLWLDYGSKVVDERHDHKRNQQALVTQKTVLNRLNSKIAELRKELPAYIFLMAFPQLISRICHADADVFKELVEICAHVMEIFPQQCVWMMMAVSKSSYQMRATRCHQIFAKAKALNTDLNKFLMDATKLTDRLLELCNKNVEGNDSTLSIAQHFKPLQRLVDDRNFSEILLPLQSAMTVTLPSHPGNPTKQHDPFPGQQVFISGFEDTVEVLPSLQKPKKITMRGSNGKLYAMMCKPKDDLRKDCRLMEFNAIVNKCLRKDPETRRRNLHIRTYTVVPLNEECGLLEWVNNTSGLRNILLKLYREKGLYTSGRVLKTCMPHLRAPIEDKMEIYKKKLLPRHPPVFKEWFVRTFSDPTSWYQARTSYARTCAVMSITGYILGLGDRHGENILIDSTNGDIVHVDFNCLFNKGETFDWPELVPFRLTNNMVDALGPMGVEGVFRRSCEVTLRVMRDQKDPLMSVLKTFIYDPLVEWSKPARGRSNPTETGEIMNEKAQTHVQNIEYRLKGALKNKTKPRGLPLSVEGQANYLIKEATDEKNLCQMYIGWAAYL